MGEGGEHRSFLHPQLRRACASMGGGGEGGVARL